MSPPPTPPSGWYGNWNGMEWEKCMCVYMFMCIYIYIYIYICIYIHLYAHYVRLRSWTRSRIAFRFCCRLCRQICCLWLPTTVYGSFRNRLNQWMVASNHYHTGHSFLLRQSRPLKANVTLALRINNHSSCAMRTLHCMHEQLWH